MKIKRTLSVLLTALLILSASIASVSADAGLGGSGTEADPYKVYSLEDFETIAEKVNSGEGDYADAWYVLCADVGSVSGDGKPTSGVTTPIGKYAHPFSGHFDGDGHTVVLKIEESEWSDIGLFGCIEGGEGRDLTTAGCVKVQTEGYSVGAVCGSLSGKIVNCVNDAEVTGSADVGGLVGSLVEGLAASCVNNGHVCSMGQTGGICGSASNASVAGCINYGTVEGDTSSGGICGDNSANINACVSFGTVKGGMITGGICGENYGTLSGCDNRSTVSGIRRTGGVCAENNGTVSGCTNAGKVSGVENTGGVCAKNYGTIAGCYNTGAADGDPICDINEEGFVWNCEAGPSNADAVPSPNAGAVSPEPSEPLEKEADAGRSFPVVPFCASVGVLVLLCIAAFLTRAKEIKNK